MNVATERAGAARARARPPGALQAAAWLLVAAGLEAGLFAVWLMVLAVGMAARISQSPMNVLVVYIVPAALILGATGTGCGALARGVWRGRRWARITLSALTVLVAPLFIWALTRPGNWALNLFDLQWLLWATATAALWLAPPAGHLRRAPGSPAKPR